jgi:Tfp pilus assembly protein PilF
VIKLHGDAHLDPKNLRPETREIDASLCRQLYPFLQDHALVFIGYGGNDQSILKFVRECPVPALAPPIFWISKREPPELFAEWLSERGAVRVDHTDFDQLMHLVRGALGIELLDKKRWDRIGAAYYQAFERLREEIEKLTSVSADDSEALKVATAAAQKSLPDEWALYSHARERETSEPDAAEQTYRDGLVRFPNSVPLNGGYANFLFRIRRERNRAEPYYKKALEIDPKHPTTLANYALFLHRGHEDINTIEPYYKLAIELDPKNATTLGNYAVFLRWLRRDMEGAELYYRRALEIDPGNVNCLSTNYATFLHHVRGEIDAADVAFKRALEVEPNSPSVLGNYAQFLLATGQEEAGLSTLRKAFEYFRGRPDELEVELAIYRYAHDQAQRGEGLKILKKAFAKGIRTPNWSYVTTVERAAKDLHPNISLLLDITKVATEQADVSTLETHASWREA